MTDADCDRVLSEVLTYLEEQFDRAGDDRLVKYIAAGDILAEDEERAAIIIQAVSTVLARMDKKSLHEKAAKEICDFIAADKYRADLLNAVAAVYARSGPKPAHAQVAPEDLEDQCVNTTEPRFRGVLAKTAYECIQGIDGTFTVGSLVEKIRSAGYQFYGHPEVSVNTILQKFVKDRLVQIVEPGAGRRARTYQRRRNGGLRSETCC